MSNLSITPGSVAPYSGPTANTSFKAAEALTAGKVVGPFSPLAKVGALTDFSGMNTTGSGLSGLKLVLAAAGVGQLVPVAYSNGTITSPTVITIGATVVNNTMYFLSQTTGAICPYADLTSGDQIIFLGIGVGTTKLLFRPIITGLVR